MKNTKSLKLIKSITFFLFIVPFLAVSQVPESFKYQAVVRNVSGTLIANQNVTIKSSILSSDVNGTVVYAETQNVTTTEFGLIHLNIGQGTVVQGSFSAIPWGDTSYFLKTEFDLNGNGNFQFIGVTQLLAVPYALYAKTSGSSTPGPQGPAGPQGPIGPAGPPCLGDYTHFIGEEFGGGIVFHVYRDAAGNEHGLIVSKYEPPMMANWGKVNNLGIGVTARSTWNGMANSLAIQLQPGPPNSTCAAMVCLQLVEEGFNDWYLPSTTEILLLANNRFTVNKVLSPLPNSVEVMPYEKIYFTSTEYSSDQCFYYTPFEIGLGPKSLGSSDGSIRPIRSF
jgi:hypothetical protein